MDQKFIYSENVQWSHITKIYTVCRGRWHNFRERAVTAPGWASLLAGGKFMASSEKRALENRLTLLLAHLLKWKYQPSHRGRSWQTVIESQRLNAVYMLEDNQSLKSQLGQLLQRCYAKACIDAANATGVDKAVFPPKCPWETSKILDLGFYPD
jgi:hypothetical protein